MFNDGVVVPYAPFNTKVIEYINQTFDCWLNVAEGGKRAGKNVFNVLAFGMAVDQSDAKIHLTAGVTQSAAMINIWDCDGFGLFRYFAGRYREGEYKNRRAVFVKTPKGEKIILVAGGMHKGSAKLIKGNTYGCVYLTEANECDLTFVQETFDRTISVLDRRIFHDLNPKAEGHQYYELMQFHFQQQKEDEDYGLNYGHFTIHDNLSIGNKQLKAIIATYNKNSAWYERDILGLRKALEGLVYENFDEKVHVVDELPNDLYDHRIGVDYGTNNPTVFIMFAKSRSTGIWYAIKEYYHCGRTSKQKTTKQYHDDLVKFVSNTRITNVIIDPSALPFIVEIRQQRKFKVLGANNRVLDGIATVSSALVNGKYKIHVSCAKLIEEKGLYSWKDHAKAKGEDEVVKENDHACDAERYVLHTIGVAKEVHNKRRITVEES